MAWLVTGGRRACFANFGLGKTIIQIETLRQIGLAKGGEGPNRQLIVAPLNVILEGTFDGDASKLGVPIRFIKTTVAIDADHPADSSGLWITNYESVRDGKIDLSLFNAASLDEADVLRGFGGSKTFREFMRLFDGLPFKFVATATPSPNEFIELLAYCAFLEVMDVGQAKTRFFKRNSEEADQLTIHPHKVEEFWLWINSWAAFVQPAERSRLFPTRAMTSPRSTCAGTRWRRTTRRRARRRAGRGCCSSARRSASSMPRARNATASTRGSARCWR